MIATWRHRLLYGFCFAIHGLWAPHRWTAETGTPSPPGFNEKELVVTNCKSSLC